MVARFWNGRCDLLTISRTVGKLAASSEPVERKLDPERAKSANVERLELTRKNSDTVQRQCDGDRENF